MKRKKLYQIVGILIIVVSVSVTTAFASQKTIKVTTQEIEQSAITQTIEVEGQIETEKKKTYYAQVTAPVAYLAAQTGDYVQKGDVLLNYDSEDYDRNLEQARLQAEAVESSYQGALGQNKELKDAYTEASQQDEAYLQAYQATLNNVNQLKYNIEVVADAVDDQSRKLQTQIAQLEAEIAQKAAIAANRNLDADVQKDIAEEAAWLKVELAKKQKKLTELQKTGAKPVEDLYFDTAQMYLSEIASQRSLLQQEMLSTRHAAMNYAQLQQLADNLELANQQVAWSEEDAQKAKTAIVSEITGVISEVSVEEGAIAGKGTKLFTVKDTEHVKAVVEVTSHEMNQIAVGQKAVVTVSDKEYEGTVSKIRMEAVTDAQKKAKLQVEIHIENPDNGIYLGTDVDAVIETGSAKDTVTIPDSALYTDDNGDYCYLDNDGIVEKRYIKCGLSNESVTEVLEGLQQGDLVITSSMTDDSVGKKCK